MTTRKFTTLAQLLNEAVNVAHTQIEKDLAQIDRCLILSHKHC